MFDLHVAGGMQFMAPLSLLFLINVGLFVYACVSWAAKRMVSASIVELIRQLGMLALAYGVFGTVVGLMQAFGTLSELNESLPFNVIMGGLKVAMITAVYGLIIFLVSLLAFIGLRLMTRAANS